MLLRPGDCVKYVCVRDEIDLDRLKKDKNYMGVPSVFASYPLTVDVLFSPIFSHFSVSSEINSIPILSLFVY